MLPKEPDLSHAHHRKQIMQIVILDMFARYSVVGSGRTDSSRK
jgi:hypothetical protein